MKVIRLILKNMICSIFIASNPISFQKGSPITRVVRPIASQMNTTTLTDYSDSVFVFELLLLAESTQALFCKDVPFLQAQTDPLRTQF
jgi:hypothetical protein